MSEPAIAPLTRACPNCGAHNYSNATVCESCGIHLDAFESAQPQFQKQKQETVSEQRKQLQASTSEQIRQETRAGWQRLWVQIILAFGVALTVLAFIAGFAAWNSYQQQLRRERLAAIYERGKLCLAQKNFTCARDEFGALRQEESKYLDVNALWLESRYGYAEQQITLGQPQNAVQEMNAILQSTPNDTRAVELLRQARYRQAELYMQQSRWEQAISELQKILFLAPNETRANRLLDQARYSLALQYANQGKWEQAIGELQKILMTAPNDANALVLLKQTQVSLATQFAQQSKFQNAVNVLENALARFPDDPQLIALLKNIYDQWYNDAISRGDWFTALSVSTQRNFRFPKNK